MSPTYVHLGDDWNLEIVATHRKTVNIGLIWAPIFADSAVRFRINDWTAEKARRIADECDQLLAACNERGPYEIRFKTDATSRVALRSGAHYQPSLIVNSGDLLIHIRLIHPHAIRVLQDALREAAEAIA